MFQGVLIFGIAGLVLAAAFVAMQSRRRQFEATAPEDLLSDEEFRRIEFGDED